MIVFYHSRPQVRWLFVSSALTVAVHQVLNIMTFAIKLIKFMIVTVLNTISCINTILYTLKFIYTFNVLYK